MYIWQIFSRLADLEARVEELETPVETEAIGFHYEPHEYDEGEHEDAPLP